jgi:transposase
MDGSIVLGRSQRNRLLDLYRKDPCPRHPAAVGGPPVVRDLRRRFRRYPVIHVVCDNARFYTAEGSKLVRAYLARWGYRVKLHYLPAYAPEHNPVERAWSHLREQVTRNHRCATIEELVGLSLLWLDEHGAFKIEGRMYERLQKLQAA